MNRKVTPKTMHAAVYNAELLLDFSVFLPVDKVLIHLQILMLISSVSLQGHDCKKKEENRKE